MAAHDGGMMSTARSIQVGRLHLYFTDKCRTLCLFCFSQRANMGKCQGNVLKLTRLQKLLYRFGRQPHRCVCFMVVCECALDRIAAKTAGLRHCLSYGYSRPCRI